MDVDLEYQSGFNNQFSTEALEGALPQTQNSPQVCPYNLYAEQISGTAFTVPRAHNLKTWMYRIKPSVGHAPFERVPMKDLPQDFGRDLIFTPSQLRFDPFALPSANQKVDFIQGLKLVAGAGDAALKNGLGIYVYLANADMESSSFYNSDGDFLIVPQHGRLDIVTEMGRLNVRPDEICVIPRGIKYKVTLPDGPSRGYILEVFNGHFELPELGPIGANGLANPRDFFYPVAAYEDHQEDHQMYTKYRNILYVARQGHSPFNVVAWSGNYAPYKYDLTKFMTINTVSFDHPDPSIFTVLTCKSALIGIAIADFVIFPPKWMVAEHTFRPPYFHRNVMAEFMGNIRGQYDAKLQGFLPGGASLHNCTSAHGPDAEAYDAATKASLKPTYSAPDSLSFMFETSLSLGVSAWTMKDSGALQPDYWKVWEGITTNFTPTRK